MALTKVTANVLADDLIITEVEGISSNDNDTTLPTCAAVKDYVDNNTSVRTVTAGGNTLEDSETLAFTAGTGISITESGGAVTIATSATSGNVLISDTSPEVTFQTGASHYNWQIAAQENVDTGFEIGVGSQDANAEDDTFTPKFSVLQNGNTTFTSGGSLDMYFKCADTGQSRLNFGGTTDPDAGRIIYSDNSDLFMFYTDNTERMRINSSGVVDIKTAGTASAPSLILAGDSDTGIFRPAANTIGFAVGGSEEMRLESDGDLHVGGDVIAASTTVSDERLKSDIKTIDDALSKVEALRGVSYVWNNGNRKGEAEIGVIAQEVEQVLPEIVREKEMPMMGGGVYKTVDYEKMVGVLIEAVKELSAQVKELKEEI